MELIYLLNMEIFIIGLAIGSFLNVLIDRLPNKETITGRSHCDHCKKSLSWSDLIPVVSFVFLKGRCRYCHKKLSWQYPFVEILTGIVFLITFNFKSQITNPFEIIGYLGVTSCLIVIFFADLKYQIIPDSVQITLMIFSMSIRLSQSLLPVTLFLALRDGILVMLPILFLWWITRGRGMGFGDVKLAFNIGFLLGIRAGLLSLYFAFIVGAIVGLILIFNHKSKLNSKIAFGPFLVIGILVLIFFQKEVLVLVGNIYRF